MKCKPKDLAQVVRAIPGTCEEGMLGRPIKVTEVLLVDPVMGPMWSYEAPLYKCRCCGLTCLAVADAYLKPFPPLPPEEATSDERIEVTA